MFDLFSIFSESSIIRKQREWLEDLEEELQPSKVTGKKECSKSGYCCYQRPAAVAPDEIIVIANYLKLTKNEFINKYLTIDRMNFSFSYFLRFISKDYPESAGQFLKTSQTFNRKPCVFLTEKHLCKIQVVKPRQCRETKCWSSERGFQSENEWTGNILEIKFGINGHEKEQEADSDE